MSCVFCERDDLESRVFYEDDRWFAFLAAPYHTRGHAILAAKKQGGISCPKGLNLSVLEGLDNALANAIRLLQEYYKPENILFASVRGDITHFHVHLIPRWKEEEEEWRKKQGSDYEKGHLLEFLGYLEKKGDKKAKKERIEKGLSPENQRSEIAKDLISDVKVLRSLAGYGGE